MGTVWFMSASISLSARDWASVRVKGSDAMNSLTACDEVSGQAGATRERSP